MTSIKCATCGLVLWATAETCKRCGSTINLEDNGRHLSQASAVFTDKHEPGEIPRRIRNRPSKLWLLLTVAVLIVLALPAKWLVVRALNLDQPPVFVLSNGKKAVSSTWFHGWFASDPSGDEIFDHYLKVSGWQDHSQDLKSYIANGRFEIRNENGQTVAAMKYEPYWGYGYIHWTTCDGDVELKGDGPDKLLITQYYDEGNQIWRRGTSGGTAWSRRGRRDTHAPTSAQPELKGVLADLDNGVTDLKQGAEFLNYLKLQTRYSGLSLTGKSMLGDRVCYEVRHSSTEVFYFDVETGLLLKLERDRSEWPFIPFFDEMVLKERVPHHPAEIYLESYREINGVQVPFVVRQHLQDLWITMTISEFKANPEISSSEFEKPSK